MNVTTRAKSRPVLAGLAGGGLAATLDIVYAIVRNGGHGRTPMWVLQSVASGLLGNKAFASGAAGAALGLACHYAILIVAALVYMQASFVGIPIAWCVRCLVAPPGADASASITSQVS